MAKPMKEILATNRRRRAVRQAEEKKAEASRFYREFEEKFEQRIAKLAEAKERIAPPAADHSSATSVKSPRGRKAVRPKLVRPYDETRPVTIQLDPVTWQVVKAHALQRNMRSATAIIIDIIHGWLNDVTDYDHPLFQAVLPRDHQGRICKAPLPQERWAGYLASIGFAKTMPTYEPVTPPAHVTGLPLPSRLLDEDAPPGTARCARNTTPPPPPPRVAPPPEPVATVAYTPEPRSLPHVPEPPMPSAPPPITAQVPQFTFGPGTNSPGVGRFDPSGYNEQIRTIGQGSAAQHFNQHLGGNPFLPPDPAPPRDPFTHHPHNAPRPNE